MPEASVRRVLAIAAVACLALCIAIPRAGTAAETSSLLTRYVISVPGMPTALCNDGTLPVFYYQPGIDPDRNKWLIVFQDGGSCTTDAACATRGRGNRYYLTGVGSDLTPTVTGDGILSQQASVNPDFAGYNHVFLHYCSSDGYAGDTTRVIDGVNWEFRGAEIVAALIEQLATQPIDGRPTLAEAT